MEINKCYNKSAEEFLKETPDNFIDLTVTSPPYDCYSEDTEILTQNGWKLIRDTKVGEKVMTLNPKTKKIYFEKIIKTFQYNYEGNLINFKNQSIDLLVTSNHKMYVEYRGGFPTRERKAFVKSQNLKTSFLKNASDTKISDLLRLKDFKYIGLNKKYFLLPKIKCLYNRQMIEK